MYRGHWSLKGEAPTGFIKDFVTYASGLTDAPRQYLEVIANWLISAVLHQGIVVPFAFAPLHPNLWVIIIDPSTRSRKSTAIKIGTSVLDEAVPGQKLPGRFSPEGLIDEMSERDPCDCVLVRDEIGGLLEELKQKGYMADARDILLTMYDCPGQVDRKLKSKSYCIKRPYMTVLGATTPARLRRVADDTDVEDGFLARFVGISTNGLVRNRSPVRFENSRDFKVRQGLVNDLRTIYEEFQQIPGLRIEMDPATLKYYDNWLATMEDKNPENPVVSRLGMSAIKMAMLHCIGEDMLAMFKAGTWKPVPKIVMRLESVQYGIDFVQSTMKSTLDVYRELKKDNAIEKVRNIIVEHGKVKHSDLLRLSNLKRKDFDEVILTLKMGEQIVEEVVEPEGSGRASRWYMPAASLRAPKAWGTGGLN